MASLRWLALVTLLSAVPTAPAAAQPVPSPSELKAEVLVWGRTSIVRNVPVAVVGKTVPETVSLRPMGNAEGFTWYVTQHYALRSDYDEARAKHLITLMELAYPHYRALWGHDVPELATKRFVVTYGKSQESLGKALAADGMTWDYGGGGITINGVRGVYNWPGGSLSYHQRYLMIHEGVHQYQMCLYGDVCPGPGWYIEGMADFLGNVVWDPDRDALTVGCLDKPTINNYWDEAQRKYAEHPFTVRDITAGRVEGRAVGFALVASFLTDPARTVRFRRFSDALMATPRTSLNAAAYDALLTRTCGSWETLEADFKAFMTRHVSSYHYVDWGWEQDGASFFSYGFPQKGAYSQTTINVPPGARPSGDPLQMDFPRDPPPAIVDPPHRGVEEPVLAFTVAYRRDPGKGLAGMGLGMDDRAGLRLLLSDGKELRVEGGDLGLKDVRLPLPAPLIAAADADAHTFGITATIGRAALVVVVRAKGAPEPLRAEVPLTAEQRRRLLEKPVAVLSKDARHTITPYLDVPGEPLPAAPPATAANRWHYAGLDALHALARAADVMGAKAPAVLSRLVGRLTEAATGDAAAQAAALAEYRRERPTLAAALAGDAAAAGLYGVELALHTGPGPESRLAAAASLDSLLAEPLTGELRLRMGGGEWQSAPLAPGTTRLVGATAGAARRREAAVAAEARVTVDGQSLVLTANRALAPVSIERWWVLGPFPGTAFTDTAWPPEDEPGPDAARKYVGKDDRAVAWHLAEPPASAPLGEPLVLDLRRACGDVDDAAGYAFTWLDAPAAMTATLRLGSDDGVVVWLNGRRVHSALVARGCQAFSDTVPLSLKAGRNTLLLKVTQGTSNWSLVARVEGAGVVASVEPRG